MYARSQIVALIASVSIATVSAASADAQTLVITRGGSRPVRPAPAQNFSGSAQVEMLFEAVDPSHASGGTVTFEPGARTAWHSHPRGQVLIITAGTGRVQRWGDPVEEVRAGDVVRIPADQKHWHGASPQVPMTHIAISEHREGTAVQWMEKVSEERVQRRAGRHIDTAAAEPARASGRIADCAVGYRPAFGPPAATGRAWHGGAHR